MGFNPLVPHVSYLIHEIYLVLQPGYFNILLILNAIKYVKMLGHKKIQLIILWFNLKYVFSAIKAKNVGCIIYDTLGNFFAQNEK